MRKRSVSNNKAPSRNGNQLHVMVRAFTKIYESFHMQFSNFDAKIHH
ncbi:hypothetical protein [Lysinibacillus xylanilyticus]